MCKKWRPAIKLCLLYQVRTPAKCRMSGLSDGLARNALTISSIACGCPNSLWLNRSNTLADKGNGGSSGHLGHP
jgi:hypothetical protein